jgi:apolipoprotein N-acyltransferase
LVFCFISKRWGITPALFSAPFAWVFLEYIRSNFSFMALPWGLLSESQCQYPAVIQIASLTGAYSISFLIVIVNSAVAGMVLYSTPTSTPCSIFHYSTGHALPHQRLCRNG